MNDLLSEVQAEYEDETLRGLTLQASEIRCKEFYGCAFTVCSFLETTFRGCKFVDCSFQESDLSLCRVQECAFTNTRFVVAQVLRVNWTEAAWPKRGLLRSLGFVRCDLSHSTFLGLSPMIFETSMQAKFLIPMAVSLGYGIVFATAITLILVPSLYRILEDVKALFGTASEDVRVSRQVTTAEN